MTDSTNTAPPTLSPYDELLAATRTAMLALYPAKAKALASGKLSRIEELFAADALGEKGKCMFPHRLDDDKLRDEIGDNPAAIFEGLSQSMLDFYQRKLDEAK
ncbi:hypothetical protein BH11CYA1_BH11CYA1_07160 [soil metagenome]